MAAGICWVERAIGQRSSHPVLQTAEALPPVTASFSSSTTRFSPSSDYLDAVPLASHGGRFVAKMMTPMRYVVLVLAIIVRPSRQGYIMRPVDIAGTDQFALHPELLTRAVRPGYLYHTSQGAATRFGPDNVRVASRPRDRLQQQHREGECYLRVARAEQRFEGHRFQCETEWCVSGCVGRSPSADTCTR